MKTILSTGSYSGECITILITREEASKIFHGNFKGTLDYHFTLQTFEAYTKEAFIGFFTGLGVDDYHAESLFDRLYRLYYWYGYNRGFNVTLSYFRIAN